MRIKVDCPDCGHKTSFIIKYKHGQCTKCDSIIPITKDGQPMTLHNRKLSKLLRWANYMSYLLLCKLLILLVFTLFIQVFGEAISQASYKKLLLTKSKRHEVEVIRGEPIVLVPEKEYLDMHLNQIRLMHEKTMREARELNEDLEDDWRLD